ncbi:MAG: L-seryl-tRNA(Sec) selenium transferase [Deltaproteobacteria bacterium]|jgi:L-seryl-tRNA(Ser) seleniumtransferase|nr:L-seryl-tRNA(Sec) selenium transferase [Deltaproteobacteria bacterium]
MSQASVLKNIPQVEKLLASCLSEPTLQDHPRSRLLKAIRLTLAELRADVLADRLLAIPEEPALLALIKAQDQALSRNRLRPVINATGIILHTNLGRAPLAAEALDWVAKTSRSYCSLEYDPATGQRTDRLKRCAALLTELTGAEDAFAVNNNAAALFLLTLALAKGQGVVVSRGELVEIGGSFRLRDIILEAGVTLIEVGATNQTRLADYEKALANPEAKLILKAHASNFRQTGYVGQVEIGPLAKLAHAHDRPLIVDLGSGTLTDLTGFGLIDEIPVKKALELGADVVSFSGDKLLGGPQAGLMVGRKALISQLKRQPLARAVRLDKMALAALEATLLLGQEPETAQKTPIYQMLNATDQELRQKALKLKDFLGAPLGLNLDLIQVESQTGGGSGPEIGLASWAVSLANQNINIALLEENSRAQEIPIVARVNRDRLLLDVRTIAEEEFPDLKKGLQAAWRQLVGPDSWPESAQAREPKVVAPEPVLLETSPAPSLLETKVAPPEIAAPEKVAPEIPEPSPAPPLSLVQPEEEAPLLASLEDLEPESVLLETSPEPSPLETKSAPPEIPTPSPVQPEEETPLLAGLEDLEPESVLLETSPELTLAPPEIARPEIPEPSLDQPIPEAPLLAGLEDLEPESVLLETSPEPSPETSIEADWLNDQELNFEHDFDLFAANIDANIDEDPAGTLVDNFSDGLNDFIDDQIERRFDGGPDLNFDPHLDPQLDPSSLPDLDLDPWPNLFPDKG